VGGLKVEDLAKNLKITENFIVCAFKTFFTTDQFEWFIAQIKVLNLLRVLRIKSKIFI